MLFNSVWNFPPVSLVGKSLIQASNITNAVADLTEKIGTGIDRQPKLKP
jgi:hypothetical protein